MCLRAWKYYDEHNDLGFDGVGSLFCVSVSMFASRGLIMPSSMMRSKILGTIKVREMGRYFDGSLRSLGMKIAVVCAKPVGWEIGSFSCLDNVDDTAQGLRNKGTLSFVGTFDVMWFSCVKTEWNCGLSRCA